jgi:hypothetical protein
MALKRGTQMPLERAALKRGTQALQLPGAGP